MMHRIYVVLEELATEARAELRTVRAPPPWLQALEPWASLEMAALVVANPALRRVGRGDRAPVLVVPGFTADDTSTVALRSVLRAWGYWAHGWGLGANLGPTRELLSALRGRLDAVYERHQRPVALIGQSAGGLFARYLAREAPEQVR